MAKSEEEIWKQYKKTGDPKLREELIIRYAPMVKYIAGRIAVSTPPSIEYDDLVSYGVLGLIDAIERYDPKHGSKFKTYATSRIKGSIFDELRLLDWVPRQIRRRSKQLEGVYAELESKYGRAVRDEEVAEELGIGVEELQNLITSVSGTSLISLEDMKHLGDDDEVAMFSTIENPETQNPEAILEKEEVKNLLVEAINRLPQKEREVITLYYYEELTLKEIGEVLGVTESRISQLHTKAILRLRGFLSKMRRVSKGSVA
ncbi:MAG: RNA polymerase sigma factor WhiG [bacterium]|nr:RNA polymerase sigma factor WhiG [bacterium]